MTSFVCKSFFLFVKKQRALIGQFNLFSFFIKQLAFFFSLFLFAAFHSIKDSMKTKTWALLASTLRHEWRYTSTPVAFQPRYHIKPNIDHYYYSSLATHIPSQQLPVVDYFSRPSSTPSYTLSHGASGFAKNRRYTTPDVKRKRNHYCSVQIGEDAYFRRSDALGVADGVGGWSDRKSKWVKVDNRKKLSAI